MTIPATLDELDAPWLTDVLGAAGVLGSAVVAAIERTPIGTGQMCDTFRLSLTYDRPTEAPASVVVKVPAADEASLQAAMALRCYEIEVRFYQELACTLPVRTPHPYYAELAIGSPRFVLVVEDLTDAHAGDQLAGCTVAEAAVALDELVRLHAPRWGDPSLAELEWLHRDPDGSRQFLLGLLPELWEGFQNRYQDLVTPATGRAGETLFTRLDAYLGADTGPATVTHGDYRLDNLLFGAPPGDAPGGTGPGTGTGADGGTGDRVAVLDWQTAGHGPALADVAYFLGAGLLAEERRAHEHDLVRRYHRRLTAAGVHDYPWEQCWSAYRRGSWSGLVMAVAASMLVERTERGDAMFLAMADRHARHALDLDAAAVIG
ncbi:MAG: phosphotransferase family protein [Acidimicrobiales bacterium]